MVVCIVHVRLPPSGFLGSQLNQAARQHLQDTSTLRSTRSSQALEWVAMSARTRQDALCMDGCHLVGHRAYS